MLLKNVFKILYYFARLLIYILYIGSVHNYTDLKNASYIVPPFIIIAKDVHINGDEKYYMNWSVFTFYFAVIINRRDCITANNERWYHRVLLVMEILEKFSAKIVQVI